MPSRRISSAFLLCIISSSSAFVLPSPINPPPHISKPSIRPNFRPLSVLPAPKVLDETLEHLNLHPYDLTALTSGFCNDVYKVSCPNKPEQVCKVFSKMAKARGLDLGSVDKIGEASRVELHIFEHNHTRTIVVVSNGTGLVAASDLGIGPEVKYVDSHVVVSSFVPGDTLTEDDVHGKHGGRYAEGTGLCVEVGEVIRRFHDLSGTDAAPRIGEGGWLYSLKKVRRRMDKGVLSRTHLTSPPSPVSAQMSELIRSRPDLEPRIGLPTGYLHGEVERVVTTLRSHMPPCTVVLCHGGESRDCDRGPTSSGRLRC